MPRKWIRIFISIIFVSSLLPGSLLKELRSAVASSAPFKAVFIQDVLNEGRIELSESGYFIYKSLRVMKWEYTDPESKTFILKEDEISFYNPQENQLLLGDIKKQKGKWLWQMIMEEVPGVTVNENQDKKEIIFFHSQQNLKFIIHLGNNNLPDLVIQSDSLGYDYQYRFSGYQINQVFQEKEFELVIPQDVEIIEME